ncbi:MAG: FAD-binding protein [Parachlamydia sp.]|nr:FAD-binding protein [Parachlamydia sp.]
MSGFLKDLRVLVQGEIRSDPISRRAYSVDASIYEVEPLAILQPLNAEEVAIALKIAASHNVPVTARGAATGITGGCLGTGLILDLSRHLNRILAIDVEQGFALCEPGVIQDDLNRALAPAGYRLGPDTSTGDRATLGGMLANNAAGARSLRYGCMADHVLEVELLLASGEKVLLGDQKPEGLYQELLKIRDTYGAAIASHFPILPRRVSGYRLNTLLEEPLNLARLIAGSEGSLGIATQIKTRIVPKPKHTALCLVPFEDVLDSLKAVEGMLPYHPLSLELIDDQIIALGRLSPMMKGRLSWLSGTPQALIVAEFEGETSSEAQERAETFHKSFSGSILTDPKTMQQVWELRKSGLGLLLSRRTYSRAIGFMEDIAVPPQQLAPFMEKFLMLLQATGKQAGIYGHVGAGCLHIRPYIDLRQQEELTLIRQLMLEVCDLLVEHGGVLSGEHGDGLIRSWLNERLFGKELYAAFLALKKAFDPENRLNPGKVVNGPPLEQNLRLSPSTPIKSIPTFLDFTPEGGIELAADLCNGNGRCRKPDTLMCPSFQASGDEYDTTRARAQALRALIHGREAPDEGLYDVLDLCIECKGCKTECPSQVDMAKMKAEFLFQYQERHGYSMRSRLFGHIHTLFRLAAPFASLANCIGKTRLASWILQRVGLTPHRPLPQLASKRFSDWIEQHPSLPSDKQVILFNDTYTEFLEPQIGIAAFKVLEFLGYQVIVPPLQCCGRPLISKGMLRPARNKAQALLESLTPYLDQGLKIVGLEPSCLSALSDDFAGLLGPQSAQLSKNSCTFAAFVAGHLPVSWQPLSQHILVHGHCHQKALVGMQPTLDILHSIPGTQIEEIPSGCCGMAGSFGYEAEHYAFSQKIGELKLLPAVRARSADSLIVADGLSCRTQIYQATGHRPLHLAEILARCLH